jgi:dephospho-CoA kinase
MQIERVMHRSNLTQYEVENMIAAQACREDRLRHADIVIKNQGSIVDLQTEVQSLHQKILQIQKDKTSSS